MKRALLLTATLALGACETASQYREAIAGAAIGAAGGAVIGNNTGSGSAQDGAIAGAVIGAVAGQQIAGRSEPQSNREGSEPLPSSLPAPQTQPRVSDQERAEATSTEYRDAAYWQDFNGGETMRAIFHGEFKPGARVSAHDDYFLALVKVFSSQCRTQLPANAVVVRQTITEREVDGYGFSTSSNSSTADFYMRPEEAAPFEAAYGRQQGSMTLGVLGAVFGSSNSFGGAMDTISRTTTGPLADVRSFYRHEGCSSEATLQMRDNALRAVTGQRPLQGV